MVEPEEIILMTKLALHEKKYGKMDKKRNGYFKWDYIYMHNWYTRFAVGVALAMMIAWFMFTDVYIREIVPVFEIELGEYLSKYLVGFAVLLLLYTGISTLIFNKKYEASQRRIDQYQEMVDALDEYQSLKQSREEDLYDTFESITSGSRGNN